MPQSRFLRPLDDRRGGETLVGPVVLAFVLFVLPAAFGRAELALLNIAWRDLCVSWDNPTAQLTDQLASQVGPQPSPLSAETALSPIPPPVRRMFPDSAGQVRRVVLADRANRSPPAR